MTTLVKKIPPVERVEDELTFTNRYEMLGMPLPNPATMCLGECEGTGVIPIYKDDVHPEFLRRWQDEHKKAHTVWFRLKLAWEQKSFWYLFHGWRCDGWHFITCPDCEGTGKAKATIQ